jgi:hypothetical protein
VSTTTSVPVKKVISPQDVIVAILIQGNGAVRLMIIGLVADDLLIPQIGQRASSVPILVLVTVQIAPPPIH